jgi:ubiquinone/menaquinone biosynthesis C-methylase UbiE
MKYSNGTYTLNYDPLDQQVDFEGALRPTNGTEVAEIIDYLIQTHNLVSGSLRLNFRRLRYINARGLKALAEFITFAREQGKLKIKVVASGVLAWSERVLPNLCQIWDEVEFTVYDKDFYKSQGIIEDSDFIPLLRNQTRILWPLEKEILPRHGLKQNMRMADVCCGCGDVPLLITREFQPLTMLGIDHSKPSIAYARNLQNEFSLQNVEFRRGDATALLLGDNLFDFVSCRLSLQIFSQPEQILKELIRVTKPGGRVYVLCEDYDLIIGYPESATIQKTYHRAAVYGDEMGMDLRNGKKLYTMLSEAHLNDIRVDHIMVDTSNTDREAFAAVIESWRNFSVYEIGNSLNLSPADQETLLAGYETQLQAIRSPYGYATWGLVACSGQKPTA